MLVLAEVSDRVTERGRCFNHMLLSVISMKLIIHISVLDASNVVN